MLKLSQTRNDLGRGLLKPLRRRFVAQVPGLLALLAGCDGGGQRGGRLNPGERLPEVFLPGLDGVGHRVPGSAAPLLINFWATWCQPCRAEMASLNRLHLATRSRGLGFLGISVDEDVNLVREFVLQSGVEFPILVDRGGAVARESFRIGAYPTTLLARQDGRLHALVEGAREWDSGSALKQVIGLLDEG